MYADKTIANDELSKQEKPNGRHFPSSEKRSVTILSSHPCPYILMYNIGLWKRTYVGIKYTEEIRIQA